MFELRKNYEKSVRYQKHWGGFLKADCDGWIHLDRVIDTYEIIMMIEGDLYLQVGDEKFKVVKNQIIVLPPNVRHFGYAPSNERPSFYWCHFFDDNDCVNITPAVYDVSSNLRLLEQFKYAIHISVSPTYPDEAMNSCVALILAEIKSWIQISGNEKKVVSKSEKSLVDEIDDWVEEKAKVINISAKDVAIAFGYSYNYLLKMYKSVRNISLSEKIVDIKIETAKNLIMSTDLPIKIIAVKMGFYEGDTFTKFFVYNTGVTPTAFRDLYYKTYVNRK